MAKSSGPNLLTLLLVAGGAYVAYELFFAPSTTTASAATPVPATSTSAAVPATPTTVPAAVAATTPSAAAVASAASSSALDTQFNNMVTNATGQTPPFASGSPDQWGYYYTQGNPGMTAPVPENAGWNRQTNWPTNLSAAQYWAAVSPLLAQSQGLTGLGFYGTLGALTRRMR